jgi:predicted permease
MQDLRLALRALRTTPIVSILAAVSLALGIGAITAIFSLVDGLLLRRLPVDQPDRLVTISTDEAVRMGFNAGVGWNYPMFEALRARAQLFDGVATWTVQTLDLAQGGEKRPVQALIASGDFFPTVGVRAALGRTLTPADDARGGGAEGPVAVISHEFWQRQFRGSPAAIGTLLTIERVPFRIVGVMPRGFTGLEVGRTVDLALTLGAQPLLRGGRGIIDDPRGLILFVVVRLKPGQTIASATSALRAMQPEMHGAMQLPRFAEEPFTLVAAGSGVDMPTSARVKYERPLLAIFAVVALVLLITCGNLANLLLAKATTRRHEVSVRLALGASHWSVARHMLLECLILSVAGTVAGLVLAIWASRALATQLSVDVPTSIDWRVLGFASAIAALTALLFGTGATLRSMRVTPVDALKQQGRSVASGGSRSLSSGLVVVQVALSLVLLIAASLFVRSFTRLSDVRMGFDKDRVLLVSVDISRTQIAPASRVGFYHRLKDVVSAVPGVMQAAASSSTPLDMGLPGEVTVPGAPAGTESARVVLSNRITAGWFATYGTAIRAGRDFDARDTAAGLPAVIVNEAFVRMFFPGRSAVGEIVSERTVVGVVADQVLQGGFHADGKLRTLRDAAPPTMYVPLEQAAAAGPPGRPTAAISVRTAGAPSGSIQDVSAALRATDPDLAFTMRPLADGLNAAMTQERIVAALSAFFGVLAVLLAGLGLYGVTSHAVSRQRAEIGIRLALGATPGGIVRLILSRVGVLVGIGIAAGAGAALSVGAFIASLLYGLTPRDPIALVSAAIVLAGVGAIAGGMPARRASRIDPATILRNN